MNTAQLTVSQLRGLILVAPKNDARTYLNGVFIDFVKHHAVATDGHGLLALATRETSGDCNVIIPADMLSVCTRGGSVSDVVTIAYDGEQVSVTRGASTTVCNPVVGTYPAWGAIVPRDYSGNVGDFDAALLARISKALLLGVDLPGGATQRCQLVQNGTSAALIGVHGFDALAICMPMRVQKPVDVAATVSFFLPQ